MPIKLPDDSQPKRKVAVAKDRTVEPLAPEDTIEYGITMEVSPGRGRKAWIKAGTTSSVREGETTEQARIRVTRWVEDFLDTRLDELSE